MTKIKHLFLKITFCWKPLRRVPSIQWQREKWGIHEKASRRPQRRKHQNFSPESKNRLWPLFVISHEKKGADYEHYGSSSWERMNISMQSIAWEQMIQKEFKFLKTWRSSGFAHLFAMQISSHSFPLNCNTYHTCFSLTWWFLFHSCFQSFLMRILTPGFIFTGLHVSQPQKCTIHLLLFSCIAINFSEHVFSWMGCMSM